MKTRQIALIKATWSQVLPVADDAAELFYGKLFQLDPSVRFLFKGDMTRQGVLLMAMINTLVNHLDDIPSLIPALRSSGERHAGYGVKDTHYDTVGAALLWTLEQGLGDGFSTEVRAAWTELYATLAQTMKDGAAGAGRMGSAA